MNSLSASLPSPNSRTSNLHSGNNSNLAEKNIPTHPLLPVSNVPSQEQYIPQTYIDDVSDKTTHGVEKNTLDSKDSKKEMNLWQEILNECHESEEFGRMDGIDSHQHDKKWISKNGGGNLLVLGEESNGKRNLLKSLQSKWENSHNAVGALATSNPNQCRALEYYLVRTPQNIHTWIIEDPIFENLLEIAVTKENLKDTIVMITLDISKPSQLISNLSHWINLVERHVKRLQGEIGTDTILEMKNNLESYNKNWYEKAKKKEKKQEGGQNEDMDTYTPIEVNIGIPLIIVICKCDLLSKIAEDFTSKERSSLHTPSHFLNFIQFHLRRISIKYGASLFYTSSIQNKNCDCLREYISHRCFGLEYGREVDYGEAPAIPSGVDHALRIKDLNFMSIVSDQDEKFESVVRKAAGLKKEIVEPVVEVEDFQRFLKRQEHLRKYMNDSPNTRLLSASQSVSMMSSSTGNLSAIGNIGNSSNIEKDAENFFKSMLAKFQKPTVPSPDLTSPSNSSTHNN